MTDLDTLREALQTPVRPDAGAGAPEPLDVGEVITRGRRLRWRRRAGATTVAACVIAATVAAVTGPGHAGSRPLRTVPPPLGGGRSTPSATPSPAPSAPAPAGKVVPAGTTGSDGGLVFYVFKIGMSAPPGTRFGIVAAHRDAAGRLVPAAEANETSGPGTTAGFHAIEAPMSVGSPGTVIPEFGYYTGPAATITGTENGHLVAARIAPWSLDPDVVIFWFPTTAKAGGGPVQNLTARGKAGQRLPAGQPAAGSG